MFSVCQENEYEYSEILSEIQKQRTFNYPAAREQLHTEAVMQMFKDAEFSGSFYRVEKTDACVYA